MEPCEFVNSVEWRGKGRANHCTGKADADGDKDTETTVSSAEKDKTTHRYQV